MALTHAKKIKILGKHIDKLRCDKGYSMREFAILCNINKSQVNELTNLGVDFRYSTLVKISEGLEIPISELLNF